jgi:hypothetical protein
MKILPLCIGNWEASAGRMWEPFISFFFFLLLAQRQQLKTRLSRFSRF